MLYEARGVSCSKRGELLVFTQAVMFCQPARKFQPPLVNDALEIFSMKLVPLAQRGKALGFFAAEAA
jgi:hypothetical protein